MKMKWLMPVSGLLVWAISSCEVSNSGRGSGGFVSPYADSAKMPHNGPAEGQGGGQFGMIPSSRSGSGVDSSEAFATPKKERPGLATTFGRSIKSPMPNTAFERATAKPYGVDAIFYNDHDGLKAMGALDDSISGFQTAAGEVIEWGIKGNFGFLPTYRSYSHGASSYRRFVEGKNGGTYTIVLHNRCKCDLQVVLSVDGLDVQDGKPASVTKRGYVVPAGETLEVPGYRTGYNSAAAFQFSSVSGSYANLSRGDTRNVGVIGLAVYTPKGADPWTWMPKEIEKRDTANPFAKAP